MDRDELRSLLVARPVAALHAVGNPLALAIELLRPDSISAVLRGLDRASLVGLLRMRSESLDELRGLGLLGLDEAGLTRLPEVTEALHELGGSELARLALEPSADHRNPPGAAPYTASDDPAPPDVSSWFSPALTSTVRAAALLRAMAQHPARLSRRGTVTMAALRELALATQGEPEATAGLLRLLQIAELAVALAHPAGQAFLVPAPGEATPAGHGGAVRWLAAPQPERWIVLASALVRSASPQLRRALELSAGDARGAVEHVLGEEFPLLPAGVRAAAAEWAALSEQLGLSLGGRLTLAARALLNGDIASALDLAERDFPATAAGIYLQPDLSLVVPGPLAPADEQALLAIADPEQIGVASTLRLSPVSLARAMRAGFGVEAIRALLERLSLTGIPQPLDFLLGDLQRTGGAPRQDARSAALAERGAAWLARAADADPDAAERTGGAEGAASAAGVVADAAAVVDSDVEAAVERIHAAAQANPGSGELTHRLELAIRDRSLVRVTAAGPDERTFVLLPLALTAGRLRAADEAAGVERTLPLSAITAVEAA